jgi:hypothetical protein
MVGVCYFIEDFTIDTSKVEPTEGIKEKWHMISKT